MRASAPTSYLEAAVAEARLADWLNSDQEAERLIFNNMETPAFAKFAALPVLLDNLRARFNLVVGMSGSGSACFAFLKSEHDVAEICSSIRAAWGEPSFIVEAETA